ncbi:serine/threonine protein kinase [bacterium]|nr:serine/threonine protein kinase [bacterium]
MGLEPEQMLHGRYRIVRILKSGGMGSVYEAIDTKLADSPCAVKEIHEAALASNESGYIQTRFYEEMKALVALDHAAIPKVRDYLSEGDKVYIVMELVQGRSLQEEIEQRREMKQDAPVDYIALDMIRLLDTLTYLHSQQPPVIHRDVKPANILRDSRSGQIKLVDFGLARAAGGPNTQTVVGTMGYCAPEQMMGKAEARSDVYAVGVTMMHLLTGVAPEMELFEARKPELPGVRPGLSQIIEKATQIKPADRYADAAEMSLALQQWLHRPTQNFAVPPPVALTRPQQPVSPLASTRGKLLAAGFVLSALVSGYAVGHWPKPRPSQALMPSATPSIAKPVLGSAAHDLKAEAKSLASVPKPSPPPAAPERVPVYNQASVPQYQPAPRPRPKPAVVVQQPVVREVARQVFSRPRHRSNNYRPAPPVYHQPVYRQPAYQPPPVQIQAGGNGVQAQFNGGGFQVRAGWP